MVLGYRGLSDHPLKMVEYLNLIGQRILNLTQPVTDADNSKFPMPIETIQTYISPHNEILKSVSIFTRTQI